MSGWKHAFSLSKEEVKNAEPPGTVRLVEHELHRTETNTTVYQEDHVQLVPRPSSSPADPLNWPQWRKNAILLTVSTYALVANIGSSAIASSLSVLAFQINPHGPPTAFGKLSHLVAVNVLLIGTSNIFWVPLSSIFGRRPVMLAALLVMVFSSLWGGLATSFNSLLAARVIQGVGFGPCDTISPEIVGEIFFVHERGRALAIYTLFLGGGSFIGGLVGGYIAGNLGYHYIFWITLALAAFTFVCHFFLVPETLFDREAHLALEDEHNDNGFTEKGNTSHNEHTVGGPRAPIQGTFTYLQSLKFTGVYRGNVLYHFLAPWKTLAFPGTWVVMLHYGGLLGGIVTISTIAPQLLAMPPYLWGNSVGLINVAGIVGTILGAIATYFIVDRLTTRSAKKALSGLAEPESRLPAMFPALIITVAGMWTFGFCADNPSKYGWVGMAFGFGMNAFGITQIPSVGFNYLVDAYGHASADCFVMTAIIRAVVSFAWTFFIGDWIAKRGAAEPFGIFGMLMAIFGLLTVPLWLLGKRMRVATAKYVPTQ